LTSADSVIEAYPPSPGSLNVTGGAAQSPCLYSETSRFV